MLKHVTTAGWLAVWEDHKALAPVPLPAAMLPIQTNLASLLGSRSLLHYCREIDATSIMTSGLWPGSWCTVTPLSAHVADIWLGTSWRKNYFIAFETTAVLDFQGPGVSPPDALDSLRRGGGVEFYLPRGVPASAIVAHGGLEKP